MHDENATKNHHHSMRDVQERLNGLASAAAAVASSNGSLSKKAHHKNSPISSHPYTNTSNLVSVMMDDKSHDIEDHSFYMPLRRVENGHNSTEYDEGSLVFFIMIAFM
jgi:hypothetical protein